MGESARANCFHLIFGRAKRFAAIIHRAQIERLSLVPDEIHLFAKLELLLHLVSALRGVSLRSSASSLWFGLVWFRLADFVGPAGRNELAPRFDLQISSGRAR